MRPCILRLLLAGILLSVSVAGRGQTADVDVKKTTGSPIPRRRLPFRRRKDTHLLIKDKRSDVEDRLRAKVLAYIEDDKAFRELQLQLNRRWDTAAIRRLKGLVMEERGKDRASGIQRTRATVELLVYVASHERPRGFKDGEKIVVTAAEKERVAPLRKEIKGVLAEYCTKLFDERSKWAGRFREGLQYHLTYALHENGDAGMITEPIWEAMGTHQKFRSEMLGVISTFGDEATLKRLTAFRNGREWGKEDLARIDVAVKDAKWSLERRKAMEGTGEKQGPADEVVISEEERRRMLRRLAAMKAGKGVPIRGVGSMGGSAVMRDLAVEYVKAKEVVQMACRPATTELTAVGYFVNAKDRELLVLDGPISEQAKKLHGKKWDFLEPETHVLATGRGIAICVNSMNKLGSLTVEQVRHLFSKKTTTWRDVTGAEVKIKRYGLAGTDPAARVFYSRINPPAVCARPETRLGTQAVLAALSRDPHGIAFVDAAAANDLLGAAGGKSGIKVLSIGAPFDKLRTSKGKATSPTAANVKAGKYPISQQLTLHLSPRASQTTRDFVTFVLSGAADEVFTKHGLTPIPRAAKSPPTPKSPAAKKPAPKKGKKR